MRRVLSLAEEGTALATEPTVLTEAFWADPSKRGQWSAFLRRSDLSVAPYSSRNVREGTDVDRSEIQNGIIGAVCRNAARP